MKLVIIESPYASNENHTVKEHVTYARRCMKDSLGRGEAPYASHLLYTQEGVLDDLILEERNWGIEAGFAFRKVIPTSIIYTDYGISSGMAWGIKNALENKHVVEYRTIGLNPPTV